MIRQLNQLKKNPTVIFPQRRPTMKTPTSETVIDKTKERERLLYGGTTGEVRKAPTSDSMRIGNIPASPRTNANTQEATTPNIPFPGVKPRRGKSSSFALVVVVCVIFVALALVGLGMIFGMLISGRMPEAAVSVMMPEKINIFTAFMQAVKNTAGIL